jgi:uncharacterized protein (TIGR02646 family)
MRPVKKLKVGDTIVVKIAGVPKTEIIQQEYKPYQGARPFLEENIDTYCSYCEVFSSDLEVEHVEPKSINPLKEFEWNNFLLACGTCNGKGNKGNKPVNLNEIAFPHRENTLLMLNYLTGGVIEVHPNIVGTSDEQKAKNLIELVGLDKIPSHPKLNANDKRWELRMNAWDLAVRYKKDYEDKKITLDYLIELIKQRGFFSIWFTVFENETPVKEALIHAFKGTDINCFDSQYNLKKRIIFP